MKPGIARLQEAAAKGDRLAHDLLQEITVENLRRLLEGTSAKVKADGTVGLYGGYVETSVSATVSFSDNDRPIVLAALAKFADNFNQEQIHVRQKVSDKIGTVYEDGSYATPSYRWELARSLSRDEIEDIIKQSGLYGLTFSDDFVEAYYVGDPTEAMATEAFRAGAERADRILGGLGATLRRGVTRLWPYGYGRGTIGYDRIRRDLPAKTALSNKTARRVAAYLNAIDGKPGNVKTFEQADITPEQRALQEKIAAEYEARPINDLRNPYVKKAYSELAKEVLRQFDVLPIKVEIYDGNGEPYPNSEAMRRDVLDNNHLYIFATTPDTFGPPGTSFKGHPLLKKANRTDINGKPLLFNDLLRAVHDYYAHTMTPVAFGPKGEEAAWKNHMSMTRSPWARWALTTETRGQNSWVKFRRGIDKLPLSQRGFADQKTILLPAEYSLVGNKTVDAPMKAFIKQLGTQAIGSKPIKPIELPEVQMSVDDRGILAEVAPNPEEAEATEAWSEMAFDVQQQVTRDIGSRVVDKLSSLVGVRGWDIEFSTGAYEGQTNPNFIVTPPEIASDAQIEEFSRLLGYVLDQKSVVVFDENNRQDNLVGFVKILLPQGASDGTIQRLREKLLSEAGISGDTHRRGTLIIGNFRDENGNPYSGLTDDEFLARIADVTKGFDGIGTATITGPHVFSRKLIWPDSRDGYLYGTRYESSGSQAVSGREDIRWTRGVQYQRFGREQIDQLAQEILARRQQWIDNSAAGRARRNRARELAAVRAGSGAAFEVEYGVARPGSVSAVGVHFSKERRPVLSSRYFGTGLRGSEAARLSGPENSDIRQRLYFYVDAGEGVFPEAGVGGYKHTVKLNNLYDINKDPLGIAAAVRGADAEDRANARERAIMLAGFDGYLADTGAKQKFAVLLGPHEIKMPKLSVANDFGEVSNADIKKAGVMAESAFQEPKYVEDDNEIFTAKVQVGGEDRKLHIGAFSHYVTAYTSFLMIEGNGAPLGLRVTSIDHAKAYLNRHAAGIELRARKFDLYKAIPNDAQKESATSGLTLPRFQVLLSWGSSDSILILAICRSSKPLPRRVLLDRRGT